MDFISHAFWTTVLYKLLGDKTKRRFNLRLAAFWGVFPDLFAFGLPILWVIAEFLTGKISVSDLPSPEKIEPPQQNFNSILYLVSALYSMSHSFVVFAAVIGAVFLIRFLQNRPGALRIPWEMGGWFFHILIDIPTHSTRFYATPFLWPVSEVRFNGLSWGTPWFLALDYLMIFIVYFFVLRKKNKAQFEK